MAQLKDTIITGDARVTGILYAQEGTTTIPGLLSTADKVKIDNANTNSHTHSNKTVLDGITSTNVTNWGTAYTNNHTHSNKTVLDGITSTNVSNWNAKQNALTEGTDYLNKTHLDANYVALTSVGANSGVASLDSSGKVPSSQLPSFVDDVLEYASQSAFPATGEAGKIYVAQDTNKTYRWSGSAYVEISASLALGETSSTAYRGDRGKTAYDHSQNGDVHVTTTQKTNWNTAYTNNHTHSNKTVLDGISSTNVTNWGTAYTNSHTHSNKTVLDGISSTNVTNWGTAYTNSHTHSNKTVLDGISSTNVTNWGTAYTNSHTHSNKTVLDGISSTNVTNWGTAYTNSHTHSNKSLLDTYDQTNANISDAVTKKHSHSNKSVLDGISATDIANWNTKPYWAALSMPLDASSDTTAQTTTYTVVSSTEDYSPSEGELISIYFPTAEAAYPTYLVYVSIDGGTAIPVHDGDDNSVTNLMLCGRDDMIGVPRTLLMQYHSGFLMVMNQLSADNIYDGNGRFLEFRDYHPDWNATNANHPAYIRNKPTALSQFTSDSTHRTVTDAQIAAWNSGGFTDEIVLIDVSLKRYDTHRFRITSAVTS